jgi:hypothetical protein
VADSQCPLWPDYVKAGAWLSVTLPESEPRDENERREGDEKDELGHPGPGKRKLPRRTMIMHSKLNLLRRDVAKPVCPTDLAFPATSNCMGKPRPTCDQFSAVRSSHAGQPCRG